MLRLLFLFSVAFGSAQILFSFAARDYASSALWFIITFVVVVLMPNYEGIYEAFKIDDSAVEILNAWQRSGKINKVICKSQKTPHTDQNVLFATKYGWQCLKCSYVQPYSIEEERLIRLGAPPNEED